MKYKHIIWDWNGTLFDDAWLCVEIMNEILRKRNMNKITLEQYQMVFEFPVKNYYNKLGFDFEKEAFEVIGTEFIVNYNKNFHRCKLQPKVHYILEKILRLNRTQSILSAMKQKDLENSMELYDLGKYFTEIIGIDNHYAKSKVEKGKKWIKKSAFKRSEILFVGDTSHDYEVAEIIRVDCILIPSGHYPREKLEKCNVPIINSLDEILNFL